MFQGPRQASDHEISAGMSPGARFFTLNMILLSRTMKE